VSGQHSIQEQAPGSGGPGSDGTVSRRKIFGTAVGAIAVGAATGVVLPEISASATSAAAQATIVETSGLAPGVVYLTDAATIAVDASLGNDFRVTIAGNRTMGTPSNPTDGEQIIFQITQGTGAPRTITWSSGYQFSVGLPQPTLSTTTGQTDLLGFVYNATTGTWLLAAFLNGFS
jgi:hypothetical protein